MTLCLICCDLAHTKSIGLGSEKFPRKFATSQQEKSPDAFREETYQKRNGEDETVWAFTKVLRLRKNAKKRTITKREKRRILAAVGNKNLVLSRKQQTYLAELGQRDTQLDAGGIGKGYALSLMVARLRKRGVRRAWLNFGGSSFYGMGAPHGRKGWPVLLRSAQPGHPNGILLLNDQALSSSLSLRPDGRGGNKSPHIIDPNTGRWVRKYRFAAAQCKSATDAEVLSTTLIIRPNLWKRIQPNFPNCATIRHERNNPIQVDRALLPHWKPL